MTFNNRKIIAIWLFSFAFLAVVAVLSLATLRSGWPHGHSPVLLASALVLFWAASVGCCAWASTLAWVRVVVLGPHAFELTLQWPFRRSTRRVRSSEVAGTELIVTEESDGEQFYVAQVTLIDGTRFSISEGTTKSEVEAALHAFTAALELSQRKAMLA